MTKVWAHSQTIFCQINLGTMQINDSIVLHQLSSQFIYTTYVSVLSTYSLSSFLPLHAHQQLESTTNR